MVEKRTQRHPDTTWLDGVYETRFRQSTPFGRGYGLLSAFFLVVSAAVGIFFVIHQDQASANLQNRERTYQQQVDDALVREYGLTATDPSRLPVADHNSALAALLPTSRGPGAISGGLCTVATGGSPDQVTVTCPEPVNPTPAQSSQPPAA